MEGASRWFSKRELISLRDEEGYGGWAMTVERVTPDELVCEHLGYDSNPTYRFVRIGRR